MPTLKNLDKKITTLEGRPISYIPGEELTYKDALVALCELKKPGSKPGDLLKAYEIGSKIYKVDKEIELTDEEINYLQELAQNSDIFVAVIVGKLIDFLKVV